MPSSAVNYDQMCRVSFFPSSLYDDYRRIWFTYPYPNQFTGIQATSAVGVTRNVWPPTPAYNGDLFKVSWISNYGNRIVQPVLGSSYWMPYLYLTMNIDTKDRGMWRGAASVRLSTQTVNTGGHPAAQLRIRLTVYGNDYQSWAYWSCDSVNYWGQ